MKKLILVFAMLMGFQTTFAHSGVFEITPHCQMGWYYAGSTLVHRFDQPTYVERMLISAEGYRGFARAYVYADGDQVATLGVPGSDPDYPVIVRKTISAIVIKFDGPIYIKDLRIYASESANYGEEVTTANLETPAQLGRAVIQVIANLQQSVSDTEFRQYLLPLRQSALVMAAKGAGRPLLSDNTQQQARIMVSQLKRAQNFMLGRLAYSDYYSNDIQTLLFVKEKLEAIYEIQ